MSNNLSAITMFNVSKKAVPNQRKKKKKYNILLIRTVYLHFSHLVVLIAKSRFPRIRNVHLIIVTLFSCCGRAKSFGHNLPTLA